jgi:NAD(P)-dependent dehydrogenase (short-subunit alcohol dehydrogenase family)
MKKVVSGPQKTAIVTGASQGIGAGIVNAFVERGFNVVANSRKITQSTEVAASNQVALVDGHIGEPATAARIVETALSRFKSIDVLINNAGIFFTKPFTDYTVEDFQSLVSTNVEGFVYVTQLSIKQMLAQKTGGSIVTITAAVARNPVRGVTAPKRLVVADNSANAENSAVSSVLSVNISEGYARPPHCSSFLSFTLQKPTDDIED